MTTAELRAIAKLDGKQFEGEINKLGNRVASFGSAQLAPLKGMIAGAFSVGAIIAFGRNLMKVADDLKTAAGTFGLTMESTIALKSAMAESGIGADKFLRIFGKLNSSVSEAKKGVETYTDAFDMMNISQKEMIGLGMDKILELMAKKYEEANNKAEFLAGTSKAFGERIGPALIDVFQRINKEGLEKFREEAKKAADGMESLATASDAFEKMGNKTLLIAAGMNEKLQTLKWTLIDVITQWKSFGEAWRENIRPEIVELSEETRKRAEEMGWMVSPAAAELPVKGKLIKKEIEEERNKQISETLRLQKLLEEKKLYELSIVEKISHYEQQISALREEKAKAVLESERLKITSDIMEREKKIRDLYEEQNEKRKKIFELIRKHNEIEEAAAERQKDIMAGKGIEAPREARVDVMQAIGLIVGGIAGGDATGRRAERLEKIQKAISEDQKKTYKVTEEIRDEIRRLNEESS